VLVIGDSLSAASPRGWPSLLQIRLSNLGIQYVVINASRRGETTRDGLKRIDTLLAIHHPKLVILELGANDGLRKYPLAEILGNLNHLAEKVRQTGAILVIVGMRLPPMFPPDYSAGFEKLFGVVANQTNTAYVPFLLEHVAGHAKYFLSDGLHPNAESQNLLLENVWVVLSPLLLSKSTAP
jgi:acyl-CoA thioesterase-1